jgi:iron complex outermembrane receptor protein
MMTGQRDSLTGQFVDYTGAVISSKRASERETVVPFQEVGHLKVSSRSNFVSGDNQFRINLGFQRDRREEFGENPDTAGIYLNLDTYTYTLNYTRSLGKSLEIVAGLSGMTQSNRNMGTEYLVPDYFLQDLGGFFYLKKSWQKFTFNAGMRYDHRFITGKSLYLDAGRIPSPSGDTVFPGFSSDFSAFSGSAGMTFQLNEVLNFKFNIGRGFRAPNIAELGSNGVHEGTFRYEVGNPDLTPETSLQVDGEIAANARYLTAVFNGFFNLVDSYIYGRNLDNESKEVAGIVYPVYRYVQGNAVLKGFEFELDIHPIDALHFDNNIDYVWAENRSISTPLPYIPALHSRHELKWTFRTRKQSPFINPFLQAGLEAHYRQSRIDVFETPTPGYVLLNASAGFDLRVQRQRWSFLLAGTNLLNTAYYDHQSRLKPLGIKNMGRNITFSLMIPFGILH